MILAQDEPAQLRAEVAGDAIGHWRDHRQPVGRHPALAPDAHDVPAQHQALGDVVLASVAPIPGRGLSGISARQMRQFLPNIDPIANL